MEGAGASRRSLASFFIGRPIFAAVLAIVTMLGGGLGIYSLSISQYPEIAPTTIRIGANYSGASAEAVENSVTTTIESALTGLDGLLYMESTSSSGSASITLTFSNATDPDTAQVQVQNKLSRVENQLPQSVQDAGVTVSRSPSGILMIGNIVSEDGRYTTQQLGDIMANRIEDRIKRIDGVGSIQSFGSSYAMRIWLDPATLEQYQLTPADVITAVKAQNVQVSVGKIGSSPAVKGQQLLATVTAQSLLETVDQFRAITLKIASDSDPAGERWCAVPYAIVAPGGTATRPPPRSVRWRLRMLGTVAILEAARIRIRPIVMTSLAFMFGVLPLALATGAGSGAQNAIGFAVLGGMLASTLVGVFFVPLFFLLIRRGWRAKRVPAET